jgi:alkanesulfonate monooxygenase SsuD/methylene tetrahydromethanopterin reductase-like flavin-dependent oxidoreductase (luciferase family)
MSTVSIGLNISPAVHADMDPVGTAVRAEELGFDFVSVNDHLTGVGPRLEIWTLLAWIAASTSTLRVATRVLGVPYRNPAVTAKMAESFDRLSGGRLVLGLGAGASETEFNALGLGTAALRDRLQGLEEAILITRGLWAGEPFSLAGRHYQTDAAILEPAPAHPIPIWLGTHGRRGLDLTGRLADGWIPSLELAPPDQVGAMRESLLDAAAAAGRDRDAITMVYNLVVSVGPPSADPFVVSGEAEAVAERLTHLLRLGFSGLNLILAGPPEADAEQLERLGGEVVPAVRAQTA